MDFYISLGAALMAAVSLVLHALAPKMPKAGVVADDIDKVEAAVQPYLPASK